MNKYLVDGIPLVECHLIIPKIGAWIANDVLVDTDTPLSLGQAVTMNFMDRTFKGTVLDTGVFEGYQRCTIIGGSGKLSSYLESTPYNSTTVGQVLRDIARKTSHTVSTSIDQTLLNSNLASWNIIRMKAALAITKLLSEIGAIWRILTDGTLWIGKEVYTPLNAQDFTVLEEFPEEARWDIYNEDYLIDPLTSLSGNNIQQVEYFVKDNELKMSVYFTDTYADSTDKLTDQSDNILYNSTYRCQVVTQHSDGTLDLIPNPDNILIKNGFVNVPIIYPFPGMTIQVPAGTFCYVQFMNGDPQYPRVIGWDDTGLATKVQLIHANENKAARVGDIVDCGKITVVQTSPMPPILTINYVSPSGTVIPIVSGVAGVIGTASVPLSGKITTGSNTVFIGS